MRLSFVTDRHGAMAFEELIEMRLRPTGDDYTQPSWKVVEYRENRLKASYVPRGGGEIVRRGFVQPVDNEHEPPLSAYALSGDLDEELSEELRQGVNVAKCSRAFKRASGAGEPLAASRPRRRKSTRRKSATVYVICLMNVRGHSVCERRSLDTSFHEVEADDWGA